MSKTSTGKDVRSFSFRNIHVRFSLSIQMFVLIAMVSIIGWTIIDYVQTKSIEALFQKRLVETLASQAKKDRIQFDNYIKKHMQAVKVYVATEYFEHYTGIDSFKNIQPGPIVYFRNKLPPWLPSASIMRSLINPRYALILDDQGRVREVYIGWHEDPPEEVLDPSFYLQQLSHNQSYLVSLDEKPFLVTSSDTHDENGNIRATLMIAEPIDSEFILGAAGMESREIVALLAGQDPVVTASNRPDLIKPGTLLTEIEHDYMVTGSSFFDYGSSELLLQLSSFISYEDYKSLNQSIISTERRLRSIMAGVLTISFVLIIFWIVYRVKRLGSEVKGLCQAELGIVLNDEVTGDEVFALEMLFDRLRKEIIRSRSLASSKVEELEESNEFLNMEVKHRKMTEEMLQEYMETLEQKVEDRTKELAQKATEAKRANKAKSDFLSNVSHELRTPMNSIMVMSHMLQNTPLKETQADYLNEIRQASQNLLEIIANILNFSNIEKGDRAVVAEQFYINNLLDKIMEWARIKAERKGLVVDIEGDSAVPELLIGDEQGLEQVLRQLLDNAIKFTEQGKVILSLNKLQDKGNEIILRFSVKDSGIGMSPENIDCLFQSFSQGDGSSTRKYGGIGLGLAICKRLVQLLGGEMGVNSEPGVGSEFFFTISCGYEEVVKDQEQKRIVQYSTEGEAKLEDSVKTNVDVDLLRTNLKRIITFCEINDTESMNLFSELKEDLYILYPEEARRVEDSLDMFAFAEGGKILEELLGNM